MAGVRLHHPTFRATDGATLTYVVELPLEYHHDPAQGARNRPDVPCQRCSRMGDGVPAAEVRIVKHRRKAIHLDLDANGDVIVAPDIYAALRTVPDMAGLVAMGTITNPPPVSIGAVHKDKARIIDVPLNRDNAMAPLITPERTRYQGRARMEAPWVPLLDRLNDRLDRDLAARRREKRSIFTIHKGE